MEVCGRAAPDGHTARLAARTSSCVGLTNSGIQDFARELSILAGDEITSQEVKDLAKKIREVLDR